MLKLESTAFREGGEIPSTYTCEGRNISPPLAWSGVPTDARSLVLIIDDPDAPDPNAPRMTWVHWVLYNIPINTNGLAEGVSADTLPQGAEEGLNDWKKVGYGGACPPIGRHRYFHKLYALDAQLHGLIKPTKTTLENAMKGHIIEQTALMGTYKKTR